MKINSLETNCYKARGAQRSPTTGRNAMSIHRLGMPTTVLENGKVRLFTHEEQMEVKQNRRTYIENQLSMLAGFVAIWADEDCCSMEEKAYYERVEHLMDRALQTLNKGE